MKKLFSVLKYCKDYKTSTILNIIFNILFAVFSAATLALIVPFLDLLFKTDDSGIEKNILNGAPSFEFSATFLQDLSTYYLSNLIQLYGKGETLVYICIAVFIITLFKNVSRYLAMFFIATIRNGVVRDLRNKIYKK